MTQPLTLYLLEVVDGQPRLLGPYEKWESRREAAREMMAKGRAVFWLDSPGVAYVGRHQTTREG